MAHGVVMVGMIPRLRLHGDWRWYGTLDTESQLHYGNMMLKYDV
jgi:hypothetical protein